MKKGIEGFGTKHDSLKSAAEAYGIEYKKFWCRLNRTKCLRTMDLELLVSIDDLRSIKLELVGLDGQARYRVPWAEDYQTTREIIAHERPDLLELYDKAHPDGKWNRYKSE